MMATWRFLLAACWAASALGATAPGGQYSLPPAEDASPEARGRQLYYLHNILPQLQRLQLDVDNSDAQYYNQPNQQRQDVQAFGASESQTSTKGQSSAKLESLEPDAELIPGAQQGQQPQGPPTQVPVAPPAGIPGLLPGQRFYIVHPQHQIYQNPLYPGLPNGFRPNIQVPYQNGYQRFYIVQAQPTVGDGNFVGPAGYQNPILIDESGQPLTSPQFVQPNFQRVIAPGTPQQTSRLQPNQNYQSPPKNNAEPVKNNQETMQNYQEPNRNFIGYQQDQQSANYIGAQPQFGPAFAGGPPAALPFYGYGRQAGLPFQQQAQLNPNAVQFSQLLSLHPGQFPLPAGQLVAAPATPAAAQQAQGRNDNVYTDDERKDAGISTEVNLSGESTKTAEDKTAEEAPQEPKTSDESKENMDEDNTPARPKAAANIQGASKHSNKLNL